MSQIGSRIFPPVIVTSSPLFVRELEHVAELRQDLVLTAVSESSRHACRKMPAEELSLETLQRPFDSVGLLEHVDAVSVFVHHTFDRLDMAFDAREASRECVLFFHAS